MRYTHIVTFLLLIWAITVRAQVAVVVAGGINLANLSDPGNLAQGATWKTRPGFIATASVSIPFYQKLSILPGLRYVQKGTNVDLAGPFPLQGTSSVTLHYLEVPVYLRWQIVDIRPKIFVMGGPTMSYLLSAGIKVHSQYGDMSSDWTDLYKRYDASIDLGLSVQTPVSNNISLDLAGIYSYGFIKISTKGSQEQTRDAVFLLGIAYTLSH